MSDISKINMDRIEGLIEKLNSMKYVIETGQSENGNQWYRKWSDGWIEQGGILNEKISGNNTSVNSSIINFLIPFSSINYNVLCNSSQENGSTWGETVPSSKTTNTLILSRWISGSGKIIFLNWYACGY